MGKPTAGKRAEKARTMSIAKRDEMRTKIAALDKADADKALVAALEAHARMQGLSPGELQTKALFLDWAANALDVDLHTYCSQ